MDFFFNPETESSVKLDCTVMGDFCKESLTLASFFKMLKALIHGGISYSARSQLFLSGALSQCEVDLLSKRMNNGIHGG